MIIGLRILHLTSPCDHSLAAATALNLMRWLRDNGHATALATDGGERLPEAEAQGFEIVRFTRSRWTWWWRGRETCVRTIGAWLPDLIHVHHLETMPLALEIAHRLGLPIVAGCDGLDDARLAMPLHDPQVAWIAVPSEVHRAHYIGRLGIPRDRVTVLPCGVDLRRLSASDSGDADRQLTIGVVATAAGERSGLREFVDAVANLRAVGINLRAVIHGAAAGDVALRQRVQAAGLTDILDLEDGAKPLAKVIAGFDILVQPALDDQLSPVVLEALGSGRPVIAVAGGGVTDVVKDGVNGLLVPPRDADALAVAVRTLVEDRPRLRDFGRAARAAVAERFDLSLVGQAALELYRSAVAGCSTTAQRASGTTVYRRLTENRVRQ